MFVFEKQLEVVKGNPLKVTVNKFKGELRLDVRHQYIGSDGELHPTKKGINVHVDHIDQLIALLAEAQRSLPNG